MQFNKIIEWRGKPQVIRSDNGPEYISGTFIAWAERRGIRLDHIQPGNPQQNAYIERYNRTIRYDWLSHYLKGVFVLDPLVTIEVTRKGRLNLHKFDAALQAQLEGYLVSLGILQKGQTLNPQETPPSEDVHDLQPAFEH